MREKKFRAWHCRKKEWHYFDMTALIIGSAEKDALLYEKWCEFTGLKDKNGVEIFEGDWLSFSVFDYNGADTQYSGVVKYCGSRYMIWQSPDNEYYGNDGGFDLDWTVNQDDELEVIGNIYESPELLEAK